MRGTSTAQACHSPNTTSSKQLPTESPFPQSLPPLQPLGSNYRTCPPTPCTPNTPILTTNESHFQRTSPRSSAHLMAQTPYRLPAPMMPRTTTAVSHPQPIALAPDAGRGPPVLRPMTPGGIMAQLNNPSPYSSGSPIPPESVLFAGDQPTRVVGPQGRRGILPSAPRPAVPAAVAGAKSTMSPIKDAEGKFPCLHCTKSYLHAKHLKRHLLRHTGDRPYMCVLCRDAFSRSDILKRHFQKCSTRRGNPTGVSHLAHPEARVKNHGQAQEAAGGNLGNMDHLDGLNNMPTYSVVHPLGTVRAAESTSNEAGDKSRLSRSTSANKDQNDKAPNMGVPQPYGLMYLTS